MFINTANIHCNSISNSISVDQQHKVIVPRLNRLKELPANILRHKIIESIKNHQVLVVCGETGCGKTTQLPKICLELGHGHKGIIGHTQPRRLAAISAAKRIAEELKTPLGGLVGYHVRFSANFGANVAIKLLTDGVLLAETRTDPLLRKYNTVIIDEAHERSLNIDFLLGYLKNLLLKRNLKLIVTSATIDAVKFSRYFADRLGNPAPVIDIPGRLYPVEVYYHPVQGDTITKQTTALSRQKINTNEKCSLDTAIVSAVSQCILHGPGDILVFLPGEQEIHQAIKMLEKSCITNVVLLPLYAQQSKTEQEKVFRLSNGMRRIILATNIAETSMTVPGIRFVVDSGLVRVKRYSWRHKLEKLCVENISRAAANQRAGRCGRVSPGICIRLYDESDFNRRKPFTDPEILRASLSSIILHMKALNLGEIEEFPFIEAPSRQAIAAGYQELQELDALSKAAPQANKNKGGGNLFCLTNFGKELSALPVLPHIGRVILAGREYQCLKEVLIIAAALSLQGSLELYQSQSIDRSYLKLIDSKSDFMTILNIWDWSQKMDSQHSESQSSLLFQENSLSKFRLNEWQNVHKQLVELVRQRGWTINKSRSTYEQLHKALLTGLMRNIGYRNSARQYYRGAHGIHFYIHPCSNVKKAKEWVVGAKLMETTRLCMRYVASINPTWLEHIAKHLIHRKLSDPHWSCKEGRVVAKEQATLHGLVLYSGRNVSYGKINPDYARKIFIYHALVTGSIDKKPDFLLHNLQLVNDLKNLEHKKRCSNIVVDESVIFDFYDRLLPPHINQTNELESWLYRLKGNEADKLLLQRNDLVTCEMHELTEDFFPKRVKHKDLWMTLGYHFEPGSECDGITLTVPLLSLDQVNLLRCEWLVPGMLKEKTYLLLKSIPKMLQNKLMPLLEYAEGFYQRWFAKLPYINKGLVESLIYDVEQQCGVCLSPKDFSISSLPSYLFMNFHIIDLKENILARGRSFLSLKSDLREQVQFELKEVLDQKLVAYKPILEKKLTSWSLEELPGIVKIKCGRNYETVLYPALVDCVNYCRFSFFEDPEKVVTQHRLGLLKLFRLSLDKQIKSAIKDILGSEKIRLGLLYFSLGTQEELFEQIIDCALARCCLIKPWPLNKTQFESRRLECQSKLGVLVQETVQITHSILSKYSEMQRKLQCARRYVAAYTDMREQIEELMTKFFLRDICYHKLSHYVRYLKAILIRITKLETNPQRDTELMEKMKPLLIEYKKAILGPDASSNLKLEQFRWLIQELRVSLFAQPLPTTEPVSVERLIKVWRTIET